MVSAGRRGPFLCGMKIEGNAGSLAFIFSEFGVMI